MKQFIHYVLWPYAGVVYLWHGLNGHHMKSLYLPAVLSSTANGPPKGQAQNNPD